MTGTPADAVTGLTAPAATRVIELFLPDPTLYPNAIHLHQALTQ
jgi:hypothetical protein